jgi:hypothetical protein
MGVFLRMKTILYEIMGLQVVTDSKSEVYQESCN